MPRLSELSFVTVLGNASKDQKTNPQKSGDLSCKHDPAVLCHVAK
jgi:hypothetical protein